MTKFFQSWGSENEEDFVKNELDEQAKQAVKEKLVVEAIAKAEGLIIRTRNIKTWWQRNISITLKNMILKQNMRRRIEKA